MLRDEAILPAIVATDSPGWFVDGPLGAAHYQPRLQVLKYGILPESVVFSGAVLRSLGVTGVHSSSSCQTWPCSSLPASLLQGFVAFMGSNGMH